MNGQTATFHIQRVTAARYDLMPLIEVMYRAFALEEGHTNPIEMFTNAVTARLGDETMYLAIALLDSADDRKKDEGAAGYCLAYDVDNHPFIPTWGWAGYITQLFVVRGQRGRGIGQSLFDHTLAWFDQRGTPAVYLNVDVHNTAGESFWRKQGFTPCLTRMRRVLSS